MSKWADYIISGIWYTNGHISHVFLHPDNGEHELQTGAKKTKDFVIALLKKGKTVATAKWAYNSPQFNKGEFIVYYERGGVEYLRTHPDESQTDNLANMLDLGGFGF